MIEKVLGEKKTIPVEGHCSLDITTIILENISLNNGYAQIDFEIYLTQNEHSILKLTGISSRNSLQENLKTYKISSKLF